MADASDSDLDKIERQIERAETRLEKLNLSEPLLRERLAGAQTAARKRRWDALHAEHHSAAGKFLALARATLQEHKALITIVDRAQREGFAGLVASTMPRTPNIEGSPLLAADLLDIFERAIFTPSAAPRRGEKVKPAKADASLWDPKNPNFNLPVSQQLRGLLPAPAGSSLQGPVASETTFTVSPLKPTGKIHADPASDDVSPLGPGEVRVLVLRRGFTGIDGKQSQAGRKVRLLAEHAKIAMGKGAVEILNEAPTAAQTTIAGENGEGATT